MSNNESLIAVLEAALNQSPRPRYAELKKHLASVYLQAGKAEGAHRH